MAAVPDGTFASGKLAVKFVGTVARTDTTAKNLFTLPADAELVSLHYYAGAASNAGTSATLSVGESGGSATAYINAADVKTAGTGAGQVFPNAQSMGAVGTSAVTVDGTYAETGTASSSGGPWTVVAEVLLG